MTFNPARFDHVIVIGAGIGGLCTARALAGHSRTVTLVERDALPDQLEHRSGVPQSRHAHILIGRGARELEALLPGFGERMRALGAQDIDWHMEFATLRASGWLRRNPLRRRAGLSLLMSSRLVTERAVRDLVLATPNIETLERTAVVGLISERRPDLRITGVRVRTGPGQQRSLPADLVVDASGRSSHVLEWLDELGVAPPREEVIDPRIGYASRWFRLPSPDRWPDEWWWRGLWIDPHPPQLCRGGAMFPVEHGQVLVTMAGLGDDHPPSDEAGFAAFAASLRSPLLARALERLEPISAIHCFRKMRNRFRHYEEWSTFPAGFCATADAVCSFNPIYAQGMSVAAASATALASCLARVGADPALLPPAFFRAQAAVMKQAWTLAASADLSYPTTIGARPRGGAWLAPYLRAFFRAEPHDPELSLVFEEIGQLVRPLSHLFLPSTIARVIKGVARQAVRPSSPDFSDLPPTDIIWSDYVPRASRRIA
jgi:2-polyprenyl-6-methoxyphenol hydroxylase-like FAD-dependent oxidoreductase